ncbi:MAG: hypothetical protein IPJ19_08745 [Planctomycetes bacterium]|nr:hypothetical protein [Planctomycetota bacterium]
MFTTTFSRLAFSGLFLLPFVAVPANAQRVARTPAVSDASQAKLPAAPAVSRDLPVRGGDRDALAAQHAPATTQAPALDTASASYRAPHDQLYISAQEDGSPQVRGRAYKAEFRADSATYIPFCGSQAPQNHPLAFRIESLTAGNEAIAFASDAVAGLEAQTVRYSRGGVTEVYELGLDSVEQKFVFDSIPASGDLVVRLSVQTQMSASLENGAIRFTSADGSVSYGAATVLDSNGASAPVETKFDGGTIELRVSASFLETAVLPITIDPVILTFGVTWTTEPVDSFAPAVAWDETNLRLCVAYEEVFSATDHDVVGSFVAADGSFIQAGYLDALLGDYWANPDVANNNQSSNFYLVAQVGDPSGGARTIHGRTLDANTGALGVDRLVSTADQTGEKINPSVGGDPYAAGSTYFTVVWQRIFLAGTDDDIHYRLVTPAGVLQAGGTQLLDDSAGTLDRNPRISKSCEGNGTHHVVWARWISSTDRDVFAAELAYDGTITKPRPRSTRPVTTPRRPARRSCPRAIGCWSTSTTTGPTATSSVT